MREECHGKSVEEIDLLFKAKTVYYYWHIVSRKEWRLADTPLESARTYVEQNAVEAHIELLDLKPEPGTEVLAFQVTDFMDAWAKNTQELAMDSTCRSLLRNHEAKLILTHAGNTNGGNFELFAAVADAEGSGIPLAYLLIKTTKEAASGAKERVLKQFLGHLKKCGVNPEFTLTDKDWSEINAMRSTWPDAKHQLCFWHALRALKQRLSKTKDTPAMYDAVAAKQEFSFIDSCFVPAAQQADDSNEPV